MLQLLYNYHEKKRAFARKEMLVFTFFSLAAILFWVFTFKSVILDANNIPSGSMIPTLKIGDFLFVNKMRYTFRVPFTGIELLKIDSPHRGDIITFTPPPDPKLAGKILVKRVVGVPGDTIEVVDNEVYVNGVHYAVSPVKDRSILNDLDYPSFNEGGSKEMLDLYHEKIVDPETGELVREHYIMKEEGGHMMPGMRNSTKPYVVPEGSYMVMGDNRDNSDDSRRWGFVPEENVQGKVFMVYFSVNWSTAMSPYGESDNPFSKLFRLLRGELQGAYVRWGRIGSRVY